MKVLIDNGHGSNTLGKCSPDGNLREYAWARDVATRLVAELKKRGLDAERIVTEETDISLRERCRRVNAHCAKLGAKNVILISIHINAAKSDGRWHDASGWSVWIAPNASQKSKILAQALYDEAAKRYLKGNRSVPSCRYWIGNFAIVRDTNCPAVLTENLFQDNKDDVEFLMSEKGKQEIVNLHADAIQKYISL